MSADAAVAQFCAQLGLPAARLPLVLSFERSGKLHLEERDGTITVILARPVPPHQSGVAAAALRAVHPDRALPFPVRAAFKGEDTLVLLSRIPSDRVDLPALDSVVRLLSKLADDAVAGR